MNAALDKSMMAEALRLGLLYKGRTASNPAVGAVVARGERVVGRGAHEGAGKPHAEVVALRVAGSAAHGATLYVTLEPCAHQGSTPPCADAVIQAGISRVVIGTLDPHPAVAGKGVARLADAGIAITLGVSEKACRHLIEDFARVAVTGRPWVTVKYAISLDGKIATRAGDATWISGPAAREYAHLLRWRHGAVLVGKGTAFADDPQLTVRLPGHDRAKGPVRVVVTSDAVLPENARLFGDVPEPPLWVVCTSAARRRDISRLTKKGAEVIICTSKNGLVKLDVLLEELKERGVNGVLVEGGEKLLGSFFDGGWVDRVVAALAPKVIGGRRAPGAVGGRGVARVADAWTLREIKRYRLGTDVIVDGYLTDVDSLFGRVTATTRAFKRRRR